MRRSLAALAVLVWLTLRSNVSFADEPIPATGSPSSSGSPPPNEAAPAKADSAEPPSSIASPDAARPIPLTLPSTTVMTPPLAILPTKDDALVDPRMARSWGEGRPRWFIATTIDVGFVYGRPRASFGFGKPFTAWFGADINPIVQGAGLGGYAGLRLELPYFDVRAGARYFAAFSQTYLERRDRYDRLSLEVESDSGKAKVLTYEAESDISLPFGPGNVLARGSVSYVTNVPDDYNVYEQTLRVIVQPPFVWRARGGYAIRFGAYQQHSIAFVADFLHVPARDDYRTLRIGPVIRFVLSRRVEIRGSFVTTAYSIDKIGLRGGDFTELGVRYRWATE